MELKPGFEEHYKKLLKGRYKDFREILFTPLRRSIRVNTLKIKQDVLLKRLAKYKLTPVPWCREGFFVENARGIGSTIEHQLGYFYVQEAASMIPALVLNPKPGEIVLDMCAAPGSKTTQMASMMKNEGIIIANDYKGKRLSSLGMNINRCGVSNTVITLMMGHRISGLSFDKILIDAPCSATGAIRKSLKVLEMWNINGIKRLAGAQRQLIAKAFELLKPGGVMVYSTCSLEPEENEAVIDYLLNHFDDAKILEIDLNLKRSPAILEYNGKRFNKDINKTLRLWPMDNDTEGFFVAKITKLGLQNI